MRFYFSLILASSIIACYSAQTTPCVGTIGNVCTIPEEALECATALRTHSECSLANCFNLISAQFDYAKCLLETCHSSYDEVNEFYTDFFNCVKAQTDLQNRNNNNNQNASSTNASIITNISALIITISLLVLA